MKVGWFSSCMVVICAASFAPMRGEEPAALHSSMQVLVVTTQDWNGVDGILQAYEMCIRDSPLSGCIQGPEGPCTLRSMGRGV